MKSFDFIFNSLKASLPSDAIYKEGKEQNVRGRMEQIYAHRSSE